MLLCAPWLLALAHVLAGARVHEHAPHYVDVVVHADAVVASVSDTMVGAGLEDVNHELVGGISTQMVWGESFEEPDSAAFPGLSSASARGKPTWFADAGAKRGRAGCFGLVQGGAQTGKQSQNVSLGCAALNRGLDGGGMAFVAGNEYHGNVFVKAPASAATALVFTLEDWETGAVLASASVAVHAGSTWAMVNFSLTPSGNTTCFDTTPGPTYPGSSCHANAENLCPVCTGQLAITVADAPWAQIDQAYLGPGDWNRFSGPTRLDVVEQLKRMGMQTLRNGGSQCNSPEYRWKRFIGPSYTREPFDGTWYKNYASPGWRIFEFLQMCEAAAISPVVTLNNKETTQDAGDLIEYCSAFLLLPFGVCVCVCVCLCV